jgi:serine/threonine protein kinase
LCVSLNVEATKTWEKLARKGPRVFSIELLRILLSFCEAVVSLVFKSLKAIWTHFEMAEPKVMVAGRFALGRSSSLQPEKAGDRDIRRPGNSTELTTVNSAKDLEQVAGLLYCACKGDVQGLEQLLEEGLSVDAADFDDRTALHLAACEGHLNVVEFLIKKGADVNHPDRWGSTPLADARHYGNMDVCKVLEQNGARLKTSSMRVATPKEIPEYEIIPSQLIFTDTKYKMPEGSKYGVARWHGTKVAVKELSTADFSEEAFLEFRDELDLLQRLRHPNVVQFLGAITQSTPMMIVTEFLPQMDLAKYLKEKKRLDPERALSYALDIARGMNYLHENKPPIIHRDLKPSNLLRDAKHLKVADFGLSLPKYDSASEYVGSNSARSNESIRAKPLKGTSYRYMAPELSTKAYGSEEIDKSVDVFSFAIIVQEMMEGSPPFHSQQPEAVAKLYAEGQRPPFKHHARRYPAGLKELIENCWDKNPSARPTFNSIIDKLTKIQEESGRKGFLRSMSCVYPSRGTVVS